MTTRQSLLHVVATHPNDVTAKAVYADYLDENGESELASRVRGPGYSVLWSSSPFESLIGKTVVKVYVQAGKDAASLAFKTSEGAYEDYVVEGDCCSQSWLYRMTGVRHLIGHEVIGIVEHTSNDVSPRDGLCKQEEDEVNSVGLVTASGIFELVHRNSSNGYYGGMIRKGSNNSEHIAIEDDWLCEEAKSLKGDTP